MACLRITNGSTIGQRKVIVFQRQIILFLVMGKWDYSHGEKKFQKMCVLGKEKLGTFLFPGQKEAASLSRKL